MPSQNELYITPAFDVNPLTAINGSAQVVSLSYFRLLHPSGVVGPKSKDYGKIFVCRRGCNVRTASYTDEFCWEETYRGAIDIDSLIAKVITETKRTRRPRHRLACAVDDSGGSYQQDEAIEQETRPETPRKKSRLDATPSKGTPRKLVTPTHRRSVPLMLQLSLYSNTMQHCDKATVGFYAAGLTPALAS